MSASDFKLTEKQKQKGKQMVKDIGTWWKTISKVGKKVYNNTEYYMLPPRDWAYPPRYLLNQNNKYDYQTLHENWKQTKNDFKKATKDLKQYEKSKIRIKKTQKQTQKRCPNGTRRNKQTGKCVKK